MTNIVAVYPGTFDPVTAGHVNIIESALKVSDHLIVAVAINTSKGVLFSAQERVELIKEEIKTLKLPIERIEVLAFQGLLINFAKEHNAKIIIRGVRAVSDFEYEFKMSCMNSKLDNSLQTIFIPASEKTLLISSTLVREVVGLGGDVGDFISENVKNKLIARLKEKSK